MSNKGRPRGRFSSRTTFLLLLLLHEKPADTATLGYFLDMPVKHVLAYLSYLKRNGYVVRKGVFWQLTNSGIAYLSILEDIVKKYSTIANEFLSKEIHKKFIRNSQEIHKKIVSNNELESVIRYFSNENNRRLMSIISNIENRLQRQLNEIEYSIISFIIEKTSRLKRKYLWPPEPGLTIDVWLSEETGYNPTEIAGALSQLESAGIIYLTKDTRRGVIKIRLDRSLE